MQIFHFTQSSFRGIGAVPPPFRLVSWIDIFGFLSSLLVDYNLGVSFGKHFHNIYWPVSYAAIITIHKSVRFCNILFYWLALSVCLSGLHARKDHLPQCSIIKHKESPRSISWHYTVAVSSSTATYETLLAVSSLPSHQHALLVIAEHWPGTHTAITYKILQGFVIMKKSVLQKFSTFFCPLNASKCGSYLLCYEKMPCRLGGDQCCKAEPWNLSLLLHTIPQTGHKVKIPTCFMIQISNPSRYMYIHQGSSAGEGLQGHCPFLPTTDVHLPWISSADRAAQIQGVFYKVWSAHAADASSVFGQSISGKPCFWQSIVWQTECTENWKVMLLDIIRKFWCLPSYVNKSPINNTRRFLRGEIQLMMTRGMRVTTNNCKAMDAPWIWAKEARENHSLGEHSDIWMHTSTYSEDIVCLMTVVLSQSSLLTDLGHDTWISLLSALLTLVTLLYITLYSYYSVSIYLCRAGFYRCQKKNPAQLNETGQNEGCLWEQSALPRNADHRTTEPGPNPLGQGSFFNK